MNWKELREGALTGLPLLLIGLNSQGINPRQIQDRLVEQPGLSYVAPRYISLNNAQDGQPASVGFEGAMAQRMKAHAQHNGEDIYLSPFWNNGKIAYFQLPEGLLGAGGFHIYAVGGDGTESVPVAIYTRDYKFTESK